MSETFHFGLGGACFGLAWEHLEGSHVVVRFVGALIIAGALDRLLARSRRWRDRRTPARAT